MAYEQTEDEPELELVCTVYNINHGKEDELLEKCNVLDEYMLFIDEVRANESEGIANPIETAIDHCISNHILEEFLRTHREEVLKVMTIDMSFERREALMREETEQERKRADEQEKRADDAEAKLKIISESLAAKGISLDSLLESATENPGNH